MMGAFAEYYRRSVGERTAEAQASAVARGVCPFPDVPPGLEPGKDGRLVSTAEAPVVVKAFEMRAEGATIKDIRAFLGEQAIERSYHGVQSMLSSRLYLGEIHFGKLVNTEAHDAIVPRDLFDRVQRNKVPRGPRPKSDRLLARLGVLHCDEGARMVRRHAETERPHLPLLSLPAGRGLQAPNDDQRGDGRGGGRSRRPESDSPTRRAGRRPSRTRAKRQRPMRRHRPISMRRSEPSPGSRTSRRRRSG